MTNLSSLPPEVIAALQQNNTIEAIRRLREASGLGLKEAKDVIDRYQQGLPLLEPLPDADNDRLLVAGNFPLSARQALASGKKIEAIRCYREATDCGLKEAKEAVEAWLLQHPELGQAAPGEQPRSGWRLGLFLIVIAALGWYFFLRS